MDAAERVRQLIEIMAAHDLAELEVEEPDLKVRLRKNVPVQYLPVMAPYGQMPHQPGYYPALQAPGQPVEEQPPAKEDNLAEITSPMVGTFYRSSSHGVESYVSIGTEVEPETVVCIIEAMKVMNEIKAEVSGKIVEILVQDGEPVEFGQVMFLVEPVE